MAFSGYLIRKFNYTHENTFFRKFYSELKKIYSTSDEKSVLIGNIICNGHEMDAIFIKSGQITIIDFKDYGGKIEFSENNPWKIWNKNEFILVAGGAQTRNPFQQIRAYRYSLFQFLESREEKILESQRNDFRWDHVGGVVLFQKEIKFNNSELPSPVQRYFHISDENEIYNFLDDKNSPNLIFSDNEIENILKALDVRPDNIFNEKYRDEITKKITHTERLQLPKKLLPEDLANNRGKRALQYFYTLLNLERYKESSASDLHRYSIDWSEITDTLILNLSNNPPFHTLFLSNLQQQFPKNLFVGINVLFENETIPVLHSILLVSEINDVNEISVRITDFELYTDSFLRLGLPEDQLEELITAVNEDDNLSNKLESITQHTGVTTILVNSLSVGLSNEKLYNSQLLSEIGKLIKIKDSHFEKGIFYSYLINERIATHKDSFKFEPFVFLTSLNYFQEKAIKLAFSQPLTVITGPPGTGKSQVVLNLIANAIINNKSILFASKNNKAVDTVKERMDRILSEQYLLRFGSAHEVLTQTKIKIGQFINRKKQNQFSNTESELKAILKDIRSVDSRISQIRNKIAKIPILEKDIIQLQNQFDLLNIEYEQWKNSLDSWHREFFIDNRNIFEININELIYLLKHLCFYKRNLIGKLLFYIGLKGKVKKRIEIHTMLFDSSILEFINGNAPIVSMNLSLVESFHNHVLFIINLYKKANEISKKLISYSEQKNEINNQVQTYKNELTVLLNEKPSLEIEKMKLISGQERNGLNYTNCFIQNKLSQLDTGHVQNYIDYIPNNIPWKEKEIPLFEKECGNFLEDFSAVCVTNLSIKNGFSLTNDLFDMVVIDEASQCDIASAIPLFYRAKKVVVIGDPLQLKHITNVQEFEEAYIKEQMDLIDRAYNYVKKSLFDYAYSLANKSKFESIFLEDSYRCHPEIIEYSTDNFYKPELGQELINRTSPEDFKYFPAGISWYHVNGQVSDKKNINSAEIDITIDLVLTCISPCNYF